MGEKEESLEHILIDEEEAKKEFLEELRTKNLEETKAFERAAIERALLEKAANDEKLKEEQKALGEVASGILDDKENKNNDENQLIISDEKQLVKVDKKTNKRGLNTFKAALIDTAVTAVVSVAALYLFDVLLRFVCGYYVVDFKGVYIITFLIILVLYPALMQNSKCGKTLGQKFSKLEVKEREE
jgi:Predicted membrane protein/domain